MFAPAGFQDPTERPAADGEVCVTLLGSLVVERGGRPLAISALKHRMVVGVLALRVGEEVSTDGLVDALWSVQPPRTATKALRVYVSELRRILEVDPRNPRVLTSHPSGYRLSLPAEAVDVRRFERLWRSGRDAFGAGDLVAARRCLSQALSLFRGEPLGELRFEDFFAPEALRLEGLWIACLEDRIDADLACGEHAGVVAELEGLVRRYPLRERFQGQLMVALYRSGRQADALETCRNVRRQLSDELGIDLSPSLAELERRILQQDPSLELPTVVQPQAVRASSDESRASSLPSPIAKFVGRGDAVTELVGLLSNGVRLVTLSGPGGSGKTRLAVEVAWKAGESFSAGVGFVELASIDKPRMVPDAIAAALGVEQFDSETMQEAVVAFLRHRELLLILDNFEHVLEAWDLVVSLLQTCPRLKVLVTSRVALKVTGEVEYPVEPLDGDAAVQLLEDRVRAIGARWSWDAEQGAMGREICRRLDCLPLAIELVAARAILAAPEELLARLSSVLGVLTDGPRDLPARQRTLRATLDWSYELLEEGQRHALSELSTFVGGFTPEAATAILEADAGLAEIEALRRASLIRPAVGRPNRVRLEMLETVREYAAERSTVPARAAASDRHAKYFSEVARWSAVGLHGADQVRWFDLLDEEHPNLRTALGWLLSSGSSEKALLLAADLAWFWYVRGYWTEGRDWLEQAISLEREGGIPRARVLTGLGIIAREQGELLVAERHLTDAIALSLFDPYTRGMAMNELAGVALYGGDSDRATQLISDAIAVLDETSNRDRRGEVLGNRALIAQAAGDYRTAGQMFDEALAELEVSQDAYAMVLVGNNHANYLSERGGHLQSRDALVATVEPLSLLRSRRLECYLFDSLAFVCLQTEDLDSAREYHRRALSVMATVESIRIQCGALETAGVIAFRMGSLERAIALLTVAARDQGRDLTPLAGAALEKSQEKLPRGRVMEVTQKASTLSVSEAFLQAVQYAQTFP